MDAEAQDSFRQFVENRSSALLKTAVTGLNEPYRPRLVLVTIGSDTVVPLSGVREPGKDGGWQGWEPVFARR